MSEEQIARTREPRHQNSRLTGARDLELAAHVDPFSLEFASSGCSDRLTARDVIHAAAATGPAAREQGSRGSRGAQQVHWRAHSRRIGSARLS